MNSSDHTEQYRALDQAILSKDHEQILKISSSLLQKNANNQLLQVTKLISLLQLSKFEQIKVLDSNDAKQHFIYAYSKYKQSKFKECENIISNLDSSFRNHISIKTLLAQTLAKQNSNAKAQEIYLGLIKDSPVEKQQDILVNLIALQCLNFEKNNKSEQIYLDILKSKQHINTELIINISLLYLTSNRHIQSQDILSKLRSQFSNSPEDFEDSLMVNILLDYIAEQEQIKVSEQEIDSQITYYEGSVTQVNDVQLKSILLNNLVVDKERFKHDHNHEQIKRLDEALLNSNKLTQQQIDQIKINKISLLIIKNKLNDALKLLKDIQLNYSNQLLIIQRVILLGKLQLESELNSFIQELKQQGHFKKIEFVKLLFLVLTEIKLKHSKKPETEIIKQIVYFGLENSVLLESVEVAKLFLSLLKQDGPNLDLKTKESSEILIQKLKISTSIEILQILAEFYQSLNNKDEVKNILLQIIKLDPNNVLAYQKLALYYQTLDYNQAKIYLQNIECPFSLIVDPSELALLQSDINLTKQKEVKDSSPKNKPDSPKTTKKIQKKKKRIRYPKNFDPSNPGPLPNPERWLPKQERKDYKKKKGQMKNRTQGSSNVGKEQMQQFSQGPSTAKLEAAGKTSKQQKNKKKR